MNIYLSMAMTNVMDKSNPPYSLLVLASVVENTGHKIKIIFPLELENFLKNPENLNDCDIFGISTNSFNWYATKRIIQIIHRQNPHIIIVLGGVHPTFFHEHCLQSTSAQIVVRDEGEITFPAVIEALEKNSPLSNIQGISYKTADGEVIVNDSRPLLTEDALSKLPVPAYHMIPPGLYSFIPIETSRGCLFKCIFCGIPFPRGVRLISIDKIARVLHTLGQPNNKLSANTLFLSDDSFSANKKHAISVLELIRETNPNFSIGCEARITEIMKNELIPHFEKVNVYMIQIGVECGYDEGLKKIRKQLTIKEALEFARRCAYAAFHYQLYWSFLIGLPWEREQEILKTINFGFNCAVLSRSQQPQINNFAPYPGSELVLNHEQYGLPQITPELYDHANWYQSFLKYSNTSPLNRDFIMQYIYQRHQYHPNFPWMPFIQLPDGTLLDNRTLQ